MTFKKFASTLLVLTAFAVSTTAPSVLAQRSDTPNRQVISSGSTKTDTISRDLREALAIIEQNYAAGKLDYNEMFKSSIDTMLHTLDPHSNYFDAKEYEQFRTDQSSQYFGIGATIGDLSDPAGNVIATYIKATFDGAPAHKAGLRYGDKIVDVNGTSMLGKNFTEVRNFLRGPRGTKATITVERLATGQRQRFEIIRDAVPQPSISEFYMIRPGIGYISMRGGFNRTTYGEFVQAMRSLKSQGMEQIVLDLRDNGGGLVQEAYRVANAFLASGQTVFTQKARIQGISERFTTENRNPDKSPIVVLVNRNSASASEILAGALQDHDRALIAGETTFGKGLVQYPFPVDHGSMLLLTIAKYETPSGRAIQKDYSNGDLYDYYTGGGSFREERQEQEKPRGGERKTDSGRSVYSGGGITPDVAVKPSTIPVERARTQNKMASPIFAFALELVKGSVKGLDSYRVTQPISFGYDLKPTDFPMTDAVYNAFKQFAVAKYKINASQLDREREFIERMLRTELVTAAYGSQTSFQVFNGYDEQLQRSIDLLPQARQLALNSERVRLGLKPNETGN